MTKSSKRNWDKLTHEQRLDALSRQSIEKLSAEYSLGSMPPEEFRRYLANQKVLWRPDNVKEFRSAGHPPTKDVVLGAWRDLDRCEALLELIDNSIDVWLRRRAEYPAKTARELNIYIDVLSETAQLVYEDNAGGVSLDKLEHLVVPGYSDTTALSQTIGSYKTGGKKAIFRLASEASVTTRYLNPAGTSDDAVSIHLDKEWMEDPQKYEFTYVTLKDASTIEKGQTRYILSLRGEPYEAPWFKTPDDVGKMTQDIRRVYTLLMLRNPDIHIYFNDRSTPLAPESKIYDFCGTASGGVDIRPQAITFTVELEHEGRQYPLELEIVLGCRTTTGVRDGHTWGIDLYGNNRLFVSYDQETFEHWLPKGQVRGMVRGLVNIKGPNVFIPWDTHKRHLNADREVMRILTKHKMIKEFFEAWARAYKDISSAGRGEVSRLIGKSLEPRIDPKTHDINIPHRDFIKIPAKPSRMAKLPDRIFKPKAKPLSARKNDTMMLGHVCKLRKSFAKLDDDCEQHPAEECLG